MPTQPTGARSASGIGVWIAILILYVVWGSTYLGIRVAVVTIPPFVLGAVRFGTAGLVMLVAVAVVSRGRLSRPTLREIRDSAIVGACLMVGGMGLVSIGEQTVPSGITGVLIAMMPVWLAIFGRVFFAERLPRLAVAGIVVGILGVVVLVGQGVALDGRLDPVGIGIIMLSPICWAAGATFAAHRARLPSNPFLATSLEMLSGGVFLAAGALLTGQLGALRPDLISTDSLVAAAYLTVFGSLVAFTAFMWVIRHAPLPLVGTYAFVNPVIAVFLGWLLLAEPIDPVQLAAGGVIVTGVALIILARSRMESSAAPPGRIDEPVEPAVAA